MEPAGGAGDGEMGSRSGDFAWVEAEDGRPQGQQSTSGHCL